MIVSFKGIEPAAVVHALYHGTRPVGLGTLHNTPQLTLEDVRADLDDVLGRKVIHLDYYRGRPLKVSLETSSETFESRLYDRDAGEGRAEEVIARLRGAS